MLAAHASIQREVTDIEGGIEATTTSDDPEVAAMIQRHVMEMQQRLDAGRPVRRWDPLFAAIFEHHEQIDLVVEPVEGGVWVRETSDDPRVAALIRQHAHHGVSEFVRDGFERARQPSELPEGYASTPARDDAQ